MPKRTAISSTLIVGAATALAGAACAGLTPEVRPPEYQQNEWATVCRPSDDGFAVRCDARRTIGAFTLRFHTADTQFSQWLEYEGCGTEHEVEPRDALFGLTEDQRQQRMRRTIAVLHSRLRAACPALPPLPDDLGDLPDIAMAGDEVLR